jgi:putative Mn2+ efflux pump MntP
MGIISILLIAIGLNFDSLAVSISAGLVVNHIRFKQAIKIAFVFAFFQGLMPFIGWVIGSQIKSLINDCDHWIAFILLFLIGAKMVYESLKKDEDKKQFNPLKLLVMVSMAIATSIDALIVGVSFAFVDVNILLSVFVIGALTFIVAMTGLFIGKKVGYLFGKRMEIIGGIILIGIGAKILLEHLGYITI